MIKPRTHLLDYRQERERLILEARQKSAEHKSDRGNFYAYLNLSAIYVTWETVIAFKTDNFFCMLIQIHKQKKLMGLICSDIYV